MEEAESVKLEVGDIAKAVRGMDRPGLMRKFQVAFDWPVVGDVQGLHPLSIFAKSAKKIQQWNVSFLNSGSHECCDGAQLKRFGHRTVAVKCYSTVLASNSTVCVHCEELWEVMNDDLVYELKNDMTEACKVYQKGETKSIKNWGDMAEMEDFFSQEIQTMKELLADTAWELTPA